MGGRAGSRQIWAIRSISLGILDRSDMENELS